MERGLDSVEPYTPAGKKMTKDGSDPVSVSWKDRVKLGLPVEDHKDVIVDGPVVDDGMPNSVHPGNEAMVRIDS